MRMNISEEIDGVNFHAEVGGLEEAQDVLAFFATQRAGAPARVVELVSEQCAGGYTAHVAPDQVKAEAQTPKWTRESLQPIVVNLAKQRDKFVALLEQFGVVRFRDLPDDKMDDFGAACQAASQPMAVAA